MPNTRHENRADRQATLANTLDHALSDSGIVYIPAFALGRAIVEGRTPTKAAIHRLTGYSPHADQQTLELIDNTPISIYCVKHKP